MSITDEKQIKAIDWINNLQQYAEHENLPMRILDELEDCKEQINSENIDWNRVDTSISELLESIEDKINPGTLTLKEKNTQTDVTIEEVETEIQKMAQRCHAENLTSLDSMEEQKNSVIKKTYGSLMDISRTRAHVKELRDENLYLQFFKNQKASFENDVFKMFDTALLSISSNHSHMMDCLRSMFQSIGGYKVGVGNEKLYVEYEGRKTGIDKKIKSEAQTADIGCDDILSFGQKTKNVIQDIIKKIDKKRKKLALIPLLVLAVIFVIGFIGIQIQINQMVEEIKETFETINSADNNDNTFSGFLSNLLDSGLEEIIEKGADYAVDFLKKKTYPLFMIIFIVIFGSYLIYLSIIKVRFNKQIITKCSSYLNSELNQFEQNNQLSVKIDNAMKNLAAEYERQYMEILHQLFTGTQYGAEREQQSNVSNISSLREEWKKIKYE